MAELSPAMREMLDEIRSGGGRVSVSYGIRDGRFHASTRRGWGSTASSTWEALVRRGLVSRTGDWDHIGVWWDVVDEKEET